VKFGSTAHVWLEYALAERTQALCIGLSGYAIIRARSSLVEQ
jgi:hypothetical protein